MSEPPASDKINWMERPAPHATNSLGTGTRLWVAKYEGVKLSLLVTDSPKGRYVSIAASKGGAWCEVPMWAVVDTIASLDLPEKAMIRNRQINWMERPNESLPG